MRKDKWTLIILISLILVGSYCASISSGASASSRTDDWTMFRHDSKHSGSATCNNTTNSAKLLWNYIAGRMVQSSPAVTNGCVFIGCRDSQVYCLNASNGEPIWKYPIHFEVWSSPAIYNGCVYIGADDGYVYCLKTTTGSLLWRSKIGGPVRSSPTVVDGRIYIGSGDHDVFCLDASNGNIVWNFPTSDPVNSSPAVSNGIAYVACDDHFVFALNAATGAEIWRHRTGGSTICSPAVCNGYVYIGTYDGCVCSLNASTGNQVWTYQTGDEVDSSPAVAYGRVYVGSEDNNVYCLNASDGQKMWQTPTGFWVTSSPAVSDGNVYVGSEDYNIYCLDAFTGAKEWSYPTGNLVESSPAIENGTLYVGSDSYRVYAFALCNSTASLPLQDTNSLPWTTIVFDAIACAVITVVVFAIARFVYSTRRTKLSQQIIETSCQNHSWFSVHAHALCVLTIMAFSIIFFINLGSGYLWVADEQTYSQWAFHMVKNGDYITPWAYGDLSFYIGKPPLNMWLMSLSYQIFGINNFASRFWSAVFGALSLVLVFYLGKKLYNLYVGFLSAIVLGTFTTFLALARHAMTDIPFVFFVLASIYFLILSEKKENENRYASLSGVFFGLALMTKQVEAFLIPLIIFTYLAVTERSIRFLFTKQFALFLGVGLLAFSPWVIYMNIHFGQEFWYNFFLYSVVMRTASPVEGHVGSYLYYFGYLANNDNLFWVVLLPFAVGLCAFKSATERSKADTLIFAWSSIVLAVFTFAQTKIYYYILPAFPAFAIAIGGLIYDLSKKIQLSLRNLTQPSSKFLKRSKQLFSESSDNI
jgi:outer membrane protein assembly factor BamB